MLFHRTDFTHELLVAIAECENSPATLRSRSRSYLAGFETASLDDRFRIIWLADCLDKLATRIEQQNAAPPFNPCTRRDLTPERCWLNDGHDGDCSDMPF